MRKIFCPSIFWDFSYPIITYANTLLLTSQEAEMQDEVVSDSTQVDEGYI